MPRIDALQRRTLIWAGLAVVLQGWNGSLLILELPAVATSFGARVADISNLGSIVIFGAIGAWPLATLADHFGRRRLIAVGVGLFSLLGIATAFAPDLRALTVLRLVASSFEILVGGVATALVVEEAPQGRRGLALSALALLFGAGQAVPVIVYPLIAPNWRFLFLAGGIGVAVAPLIWRYLPEGRVWQRAHVSGSTFRLLIRPPWRLRVLTLAISGLVGAILGEPAALFVNLYASRDLGMSPAAISWMIAAAAVFAILGYMAGGYVSDRFGRRLLAVLLGIATAVFTAGGFVAGTFGFVAANLLWSAFASAATPVVGAWSGELYPTRARATAEATSAVAGTVGGIVGLQLVAQLTPASGLGRAVAVMALGGIASSALLLLLPETKGQPLPD